MEIGYACINTTLSSQTPKITTNRGMVKRTFKSKGLSYVSELVTQNLVDLKTIIQWNYNNGINVYRMSSDLFPWMSEYKFEDLPNFTIINELLTQIGDLSKSLNQRLTFHPGPFNVLCSPTSDVVKRTIIELNQHARIMDLMGLSTTPYNKINIHVGGVYGDKKTALERWCSNFNSLSDSTKKRLTIENDDNLSGYTVEDLLYITQNTGVPIVFDYHHHFCNPGKLTQSNALELSISTWPNDIKSIVHVSEPRDNKNIKAHHDYVYNVIDTYGHDVDIVLESKAKELAVLLYRENLVKNLVPNY